MRFEGITGSIEFGEDASPYDKSYDIVNFRSRSFEVVGAWSGIDGIHMTRQVMKLHMLQKVVPLPRVNPSK